MQKKFICVFLLYLIMQNIKYIFLIILSFFALLFCFCEKKKDNVATPPSASTNTSTTTITGTLGPIYFEDTTGITLGNPTATLVTVTGTSTNNLNPSSQNSSLQTGGAGWSNLTCASTNSLTLKTINGNTDVTITFSAPPTFGTYQVSQNLGAGLCSIIVNNAPSQPAGVVWYGKTGSVTVTSSTAGISGVFNNVSCVQQTFNFPQVTINGTLGCN